MRISEQWLREWVSPRLTTRALADRLTLAGLEVGGITPVAAPLARIVVGEILSVEPHRHADRLRVCQVKAGKGKPLAIVCGASNVAAGLKVPTALVGAVLPDGTAIRQAAVRGIESSGMLCSAAELGLEEVSEGLLVLDADARVGTSVYDCLALDDRQLEVDLTPNRGDCLSILGTAREVAALTGAPLNMPAARTCPVRGRRRIKVTVQAKQDCAHYVGRVMEGIDPKAGTPLWMRERLRRAGVRTIHPVVDVTNYVMLELGQPMHAFDLDKLSGDIQVRAARKGEHVTLLDGSRLTTEAGALLIADARGPLALAGIMGGMDSAVSDTTVNLFLESAFFRPEAIGMQARRAGLHTESSHRFERGVDPQLQRRALERATALLLEIVGGRAGPVTEQLAARYLPRRAPVMLRAARLTRLLGMTPAAAQVAKVLKALGMQVRKAAGGWQVTPPSWRFDVKRECDLIEEVARLVGYDRLPPRAPQAALRAAALPEAQISDDRLRDALVDRDYQEAITYGFVDPVAQALVDPDHAPRVLANPIAANMAAMRTSLWPGLLQAVVHNQNRQQTRIRLFEIGRRFLPTETVVAEEPVIAGVVSGTVLPKQWGVGPRSADFFDIKGDVEALLGLAGEQSRYRFRPARHPAIHPGQGAEIVGPDDGDVGVVGALHPRVLAQLGIDGPLFVFELRLSVFRAGRIPRFVEVSRFPAIRRDLAVVVDNSRPAQLVMDCVREVAGELLVNLQLFDEYRGEGIDSGRKSLALGLTFQDTSRTLNEEAVEAVMGQVVTALETRLGAVLRQ